jgi:hypothetical protein
MSQVFRFLIAIIFILIGCDSIRAQQARSDCASMEYANHNQIDYLLRVTSIQGTVKVSDEAAAGGACIGVFAESDRKLLATVKANERGSFQIAGIENGTYRLVVTADGLCVANAKIVVTTQPRVRKKLIAVMKPRGIDVCSYIELK